MQGDVTRTIARKWLADVPEDKVFWVQGGMTLKNLADLEAALKTMSDDTFNFHLNINKNDFSNWVRDVIGDEKLAGDLWVSTTRAQTLQAVSDRLAYLKRRSRSK
ncbi:MAG: hypothetical protein Q7R57_00035 [Dehalococcoidales bacterium]|nr:hypothetical protein [Dehalococcoidales bacterium]